MLKFTAPRHMGYGGAAVLGYDLIREFMRHHDETNMRPKVVDHLIAMSIIGASGGFIATNTIRGAFQGFLFIGLNFGLMSWWWQSMGTRPGAIPAGNYFYYDADVTPEEKERLEMEDQVQILAYNMCK